MGAFEAEATRRIVIRSARAKAAIVAADERESDSRALLNLGHTFAHAIESATGYGEWRHGEAVAAGVGCGGGVVGANFGLSERGRGARAEFA